MSAPQTNAELTDARTPRLVDRGEASARSALEAMRGRRFSDEEWGVAKARLLAFARLIDAWVGKPGGRGCQK